MNVHDLMSHVLARDTLTPKKSNRSNKSEPSSKTSFSKVLENRILHAEDKNMASSPLDMDKLEDLLDNVHFLGEELVVEPSYANVKKYKEKIKEFLEHIVHHAVDLKSDKGQVRHDYRRSKYTIVEIVNQKLDKLAGSVLQNQSHQLKLLDSIGEIQGLLVDLIR